ncbi:MAG TPA: flagellar basal body-associated FliL family protein [Nitrospirae bacterium]|nr:flagellar basal body-associated FliL family protein [Nitrospirota bacterium]
MAKKKRRTELDIDPSILSEGEAEASSEQDAPAAPAPAAKKESEAKEGPAEGGAEKRKINKAKLALIAVGAMGAVSLATAIVWGIITSPPEKMEEPEKAEVEKVVKKEEPVVVIPKIEVNIPPIFVFKPFLVNLGKGEDRRLVRVNFSAQMSGDKVNEEIKRNLVLIRENIYYFLQSKSIDMFRVEEKKKRMAVDMAIVLNRSIQSGAITKILVSGLVIK